MNGLIGAIRGPVLMIALGVLFALDQMGIVSFWLTWPALLIVYGLFRLAQRADHTGANQVGAKRA